MKVRKLSVILALLGVILAAGFFSTSVQAEAPGEEEFLILVTPEQACMQMIHEYEIYGVDRGSFWSEEYSECWLRTNILGSTCFPAYEVLGVDGYYSGGFFFWSWVDYGCVMLYARPEVTIIDPSMGSYMFPNGGTFDHDYRTCEGRCRIAVYALTDVAKRKLDDAPGEVIGQAYIQIFDQLGDLDYGPFTFCLPHFALEDLAFYRLGSGNQWVYMGGYVKGRNFCMEGTMSGNYILVDLDPQ